MTEALVFLGACVLSTWLTGRWWVRRLRRLERQLIGEPVDSDNLMALCNLDLLCAQADFEVDALALRTKPDAVLYEALTSP